MEYQEKKGSSVWDEINRVSQQPRRRREAFSCPEEKLVRYIAFLQSASPGYIHMVAD